MPTTRRRHMITETDDVADALRLAARRWPEDHDKPARLIAHLLEEARNTLRGQDAEAIAARREAVAKTAGVATGMYEPGYLAKLREDWPE